MMKRTMKAMISQPMAGRTKESIETNKARIASLLTSRGYDVVDAAPLDVWENSEALDKKDVLHIQLYYLANSIKAMSTCDAVFFCAGWEDARGCQIEHDAATKYGLKCIFETESID